MKLATIDIGTNTALLLVARALRRGGEGQGDSEGEGKGDVEVEVLDDQADITRLGRGIGTSGRLEAAAITRTLAAMHRYAEVARGYGAPIVAVGTEALRRASNAAAFLEPAAEALGVEVEVIDGLREAELTFRAAAASFPELAVAGPLTVVDIGGGSTEVIVAEGGRIVQRESLPLGSVRLTERHVRHDPPTSAETGAIEEEIQTAVAHLSLPRRGALVGVAGTVTSLAAMALQLPSYDPARVHGFALPVIALDQQIQALQAATQADREQMIGLDPGRADVILAGALVLRALARRVGNDVVRVSDRGIRWGLLYEALDVGPDQASKGT